MFCPHCGRPMNQSDRFCSACGTSIGAAEFAAGLPPAAPQALPAPGILRPRQNRMIAGVCAGFALHYGWDLSLVRVVCALLIVLTGVGLLAYLAAWIIIPEAPYALPTRTGIESSGPPL